jgi:hypothetical protein
LADKLLVYSSDFSFLFPELEKMEKIFIRETTKMVRAHLFPIFEMGSRKFSLAFSLFTVALISLQVAGAQEVETTAPGGVTGNEVGSTPDVTGINSLSDFPVHFSLSLHEGYDDNAGGGSGGQGSSFTTAGLTLFYGLAGATVNSVPSFGAFGARSGSFARGGGQGSSENFTITSGANVTYYPGVTNGQTNDLNAFLDLLFSHNISPQAKVSTSVYAAYRTEPDFSGNVGIENRRANYFSSLDNISLNYHWSLRLSTVTNFNLQRVNYQSSTLSYQNRTNYTVGENLSFDLQPDTSLLAEYRFQIVNYDSSPRSSTTHYAIGGIRKDLGPQLKAVVQAGATFRSYDNDGNRTDPYFESSVIYTGAHSSSLSWNTRYGVEEPSSQTVLSRTTFRTGVQLGYAVTGRINATLAGFYHHDDNQGFTSMGITNPGFTENSLDVDLGASYIVRRFLMVSLNYQHVQVSSGQPGRDTSRNRYSAGLTFSY